MKLREMSEEQIDALCRHLFKKYGKYDENRCLTTSFDSVCQHCPFAVGDGYGTYACASYIVADDDDYSLEELMKD